MRQLLLIALLGVLSGCGAYKQPEKSSSTATIKDSSHLYAPYHWHDASVIGIDGQDVGMKMGVGDSYRLTSGSHMIMVNAGFCKSFGWCNFRAKVYLPLMAKPGEIYHVEIEPKDLDDQDIQKAKIAAWIVNANGARVGGVVTAPTRPYL